MQSTDQTANIDASAYKGILPVHMRQGIPPYLQILFAARPPLPFVTPVPKPHKIKLSGFFDGTDFVSIRRRMEENAKIRQEEVQQLGYMGQRRYKMKSRQMKEKEWVEKMRNHIHFSKQQYKEWLRKELYDNANKSGNPKKTLIVANLVN
jgi:hypothetical protein